MGVLKVNVGSVSVPDWRNVGCGGAATYTFADDFNRANNASLGTNWLTASRSSVATIGITSNHAAISGTADFDNVIAYPTAVAAANSPDFDMTLTAGTVSASTSRLGAFRMANPTGGGSMSYWILLADRITYLAPGFGGGTIYGISPNIAAGDVVRVRAEGDHLQVWVNSVLRVDQVDTQGNTAVLHGLGMSSAFTTTVDVFSISSISQPGRLKLWDGTRWMREVCDDDAGPTVSDAFARSDSATVLGGPWSLYSTTGSLTNIGVGISSGKGYVSRTDTVSSHVTKAFAYVDTGSGDVDMTITVSGFSSTEEAGIVVRLAPDGSHIRITRATVYTVSAVTSNSYVVTSLGLATNIGSGATVRIVCTGTTIEVFKNGVSQGTVTTSHNQTATRHGWSSDSVFDPAARFDDATITTPLERHPLKMWDGTTWQTVACMTPA